MIQNNNGLLIVLSGPSGAGKDTIIADVLKRDNSFTYSVSTTTRPIRNNEVEKESYYFVSYEKFRKMIANNEFLEYAKYCDNYYGTSKKEIETKLNQGKNIILNLETEGAFNVKKEYPNAILIMMIPENIQSQRRRLELRATDSKEKINERLEKAKDEVRKAILYDYVIINKDNDIESTIEEFFSIIQMRKIDNEYKNSLIENYFKEN